VPVTITTVTASGPFAVTSQCGASLAPAAICPVAIAFTPMTLGQQTGSLTVLDDAVGSPQNIALTGTGVAALLVSAQAGGSISATVNSGSTATYALMLAAGPGFGGTVTLACNGAPTNAACTLTPSTLTLSTGGSGNFSVTVSTSQQITMNRGAGSPLHLAGAGLLVGMFILPFFAKRSRLTLALVMISALLVTVSIEGCSGGSSTKPPSNPSVAPGTYQLVITATAGSANATQNLTLVVH
jgi:hypothetical protein